MQSETIYQTTQFLPLSQTMPLLNPKYPEQYYENFKKLKIRMENQIFDKQTNRLAEAIIPFGEGNYNCWYVKKMCLMNGSISYQHEDMYSALVLKEKVKNFQIWEHRRFLSQKTGQYEKEYALINKMLEIQYKNYHAWSFRIWIVNHVKNFQEQLLFTNKMINQDIYNNSAWSYRYHLVRSLIQKQQNHEKKRQMMDIQLAYVMIHLQKAINNEAGWNYLRGFFSSIKLKNIPCANNQPKKLEFEYADFPKIQQFIKFQITKIQEKLKDQKSTNKGYYALGEIQCMITLVHLQSQTSTKQNIQFAKNTCLILADRQKQKQTYWKWVSINLCQCQ